MIVYRHRRNDNLEIFYIGIGKTDKRAYSIRDRNRHWHNIVNKCGYTVEIIATPDTWEEACDLEMLLISEYGRRDLGTGQLVNMTSGGEGVVGNVCSDETRAKMSKFMEGNTYMLGKKHSEETKVKQSEASKGNTYNLGNRHSEETKAKIGAANIGKKLSEETKAKIGAASKGNTYNLGKNHSEKSKQKMSEAQQGSKGSNAKLTEQQAYEIKYNHKNLRQKEIASMYGVSLTTVSEIRNNKTWKHI